MERTKGMNKRFLRYIVGVIWVAQQQIGKPKYGLPVLLNQQIIGTRITVSHPTDEVSLVHKQSLKRQLFRPITAEFSPTTQRPRGPSTAMLQKRASII